LPGYLSANNRKKVRAKSRPQTTNVSTTNTTNTSNTSTNSIPLSSTPMSSENLEAIAALGLAHSTISNTTNTNITNNNNYPTVNLNPNGTSSLTFFGQKSDNRFFHAPVKFTLTEIVQATQNSWQQQQEEIREKFKRKRMEEDELKAQVKKSKKEEHSALMNHLKSHENSLISSILQSENEKSKSTTPNSTNSTNANANNNNLPTNVYNSDVHLRALLYLAKQKNGSIRKIPLSQTSRQNNVLFSNNVNNNQNNTNLGKSDDDLMEL